MSPNKKKTLKNIAKEKLRRLKNRARWYASIFIPGVDRGSIDFEEEEYGNKIDDWIEQGIEKEKYNLNPQLRRSANSKSASKKGGKKPTQTRRKHHRKTHKK
jgi:hypothetical protein